MDTPSKPTPISRELHDAVFNAAAADAREQAAKGDTFTATLSVRDTFALMLVTALGLSVLKFPQVLEELLMLETLADPSAAVGLSSIVANTLSPDDLGSVDGDVVSARAQELGDLAATFGYAISTFNLSKTPPFAAQATPGDLS